MVLAMTHPRLPASSSPKRGESVSDRLVRFPGTSWQEIEALPQPLRRTVQRAIFHLLDEPVQPLLTYSPLMTRCLAPMNSTCHRTA
jgi:hypothetical protein